MLIDRNDERYDVALRSEAEIVWRDNPRYYDYLREHLFENTSRARTPGRGIIPGRVVAYGIAKKDSVSDQGTYIRRVFWVELNDDYPGGCPADAPEAVAIDSVKAGQRSSK